jgi:hypothetical protein
MKLTKYLLSISLFLFALPSFGEGTQTWQQKSYDDFSKGTAKGIAIRSDGALELAPAFKAIHTSPSTFIWAVAPAPEGAIYVGAGSPARVYRVNADGNATVLFEPKELQVQALAVDKEGNVYAATSPDGKVYKIVKSAAANKATPAPKTDAANKDASTVPVDPNYSSSVFFDPKTKYIWTIGFDSDGRLYVGTGDRGEIFRVTKTGESSVFFKSDEAHIRTLAFDANNNVIAGSDGSGLVYRITSAGEGFVLYSAPKKEITALALDSVGNIYVAAVGEKRIGATTGAPSIVSQLVFSVPGATGGLNAPQLPNLNSSGQTGGSDIYMLAADGSPKRLWTSKDDVVYALAFDARGRLLAGTGNKGRIVAIEKSGDYSDLLKASATQVTGFASAPGHALFAVTSNLGKVFKLSAAPDAEGTFESDVYDAHIFSRWGRAEVRGSGDFEFFTRSGNVDNPDRNWSPWKKVDLSKDARIEAPPARFIQWKVAMQAKSGARLENVKVNYRPKNVAPVIDEIAVQAGAKFNSSSSPRVSSDTVMVNLGSQNSGNNSALPRFDSPVSAQRDRGSIAVRWSAHDDNDDDLFYSLYYKGDGETRWKLLKDKITDKFYSWDAGLLPDGGYTVRVVASDAPSHSPDEALLDSKESARFEVDSTAPRIDGLAAKIDGGVLHITFTSRDTFSAIKRAEFSVDANDWQFVEPVGQLSDAQMEAYDFNAPLPVLTPEPDSKKSKGKREKMGAAENDAQGLESTTQPDPVLLSNEHVVVVRVYDRFDNVGIAKIVVK